jgi:hypothetical protein
MKFIGWYSILLGVSVIGMWGLILMTQTPPEGPVELTFHLVSEALMAVVCIFGGLFILKARPAGTSLALIGHAMVIYSTLNAAGYYGQRGESGMVIFFVLLMLISGAVVVLLLCERA